MDGWDGDGDDTRVRRVKPAWRALRCGASASRAAPYIFAEEFMALHLRTMGCAAAKAKTHSAFGGAGAFPGGRHPGGRLADGSARVGAGALQDGEPVGWRLPRCATPRATRRAGHDARVARACESEGRTPPLHLAPALRTWRHTARRTTAQPLRGDTRRAKQTQPRVSWRSTLVSGGAACRAGSHPVARDARPRLAARCSLLGQYAVMASNSSP